MGKLSGQIDLNDAEKRVRIGIPSASSVKLGYSRSLPSRIIQVNNLLRTAMPSKRILFNELGI